MDDLRYFTELLRRHLSGNSAAQPCSWTILKSTVEGRGVFATADIFPGDVIFVDRPLISGPRYRDDIPLGCVRCNAVNKTLYACESGCRLPVCSSGCQNSDEHKAECDLLLSWRAKKQIDTKTLMKCMAPIRSLLLEGNAKELLMNLAAHRAPNHGVEVKALKEHYEIDERDEIVMEHACRALDTNAYEMIMVSADECVNLRGLFPMSAMLNHMCSPNTRTSFDDEGRMQVIASAYIPEGTEIFTSYTKLLWGTAARRHLLSKTKHFSCDCFRCCDTTELGTRLSALRCVDRKCRGSVLPSDPLDPKSGWECDACDIVANPSQIGVLQTAVARLVGSVSMEDPSDILDFVENHLCKFLPPCNYIVVELKLQIVWQIGEVRGYEWKEVNGIWLSRVEGLCKEALITCESLRLGASSLAARLHLRLHSCLLEKRRRLRESDLEIPDIDKQIIYHLNKSYEILKRDVTAPKDLKLRVELADSGVKKLLEYEN